ncbi:MAG: rhombotarget lipoprotein [Pseudomonadota bacterium]
MQLLRTPVLIVGISLLTGCTSLMQQFTDQGTRRGISSSLVEYLYPKGETPPNFEQTTPRLNLPLRVGIAFVPSYADESIALNATHKSTLLNKVKTSFSSKPYVHEIIVIPETYMRSSRGFDGVDQIARLYALDIIALISYDQVVYTDDMRSAILYWTIVGAYFINGSKNDINTFVDVAVFDINSHKLLMRAPGTDEVIAKSSLINSSEKLRTARQESFSNAIDNMTLNLSNELANFKERIKEDESVEIAYRPGYSGGGGSLSWIMVLLLFSLFTRHNLKNYSWNFVSKYFNRYWQYTPDPRF